MFAAQVDAATTVAPERAQDAPIVADRDQRAVLAVRQAAGQQRAQVGGTKRHTGSRFEHALGIAVAQHAIVARQQQRGVTGGGRKNEDRCAERRVGFEAGRIRALDTDAQVNADALTAHRATDRHFRRQRPHVAALTRRCGEDIRGVNRRR